MRPIDCEEPRTLLRDGRVTLVEALPAVQYEAEHVPGAVNLPRSLTEPLARQQAWDRSGTAVTCCSGQSCGGSRAAAAVFTGLGYIVVRIDEGGKADWAQVGLPLHGTRTTTSEAA